MIKLFDSTKTFEFSFPSNYDEITKEVLIDLTSHVNIPKNKAILCLIGNNALFEVASSIKGKKNTNTSVIPLIAKGNEEWLKETGFHIGDSAVINNSDLERGTHLHINSGCSYDALCRLFVSDEKLRTDAVRSQVVDTEGNPINYLYTIEFKIVNTYDISASVSLDSELKDIFEVKEVKSESK